MKSKVYFTREITPEAVVRLYSALGVKLPGKVAVKVHSGEKGNQNFLRPEFWKPMVAEDPCMKDIGILASLDPVAIDQACIDLVMNSDDPGKEHFMERVNSRNGIHTIEAAADLGMGSREYELIEL